MPAGNFAASWTGCGSMFPVPVIHRRCHEMPNYPLAVPVHSGFGLAEVHGCGSTWENARVAPARSPWKKGLPASLAVPSQRGNRLTCGRRSADGSKPGSRRPAPAVFPRPGHWPAGGGLAAASLLLGVVTLVSTLRILRQPPGPVAADLKPPSRVVMRSATVGSRPATVYYFQSQNPDRWIVWVQKT